MSKLDVKVKINAKRRALVKPAPVRSLVAAKRAALRSASSANKKPVADVRRAFGFFPVDVDAEVLSWPKL